ncbi:MAG: type II toxin-antitoxin system RelE/ParE family toxin [Duncaniella sp.]|nr:type II toxin-antitoxin system RelE/ParE family toxin [Duncaniella sp.]
MIVTFETDPLRVLYEEGRSPDRKHRFQPDIIRRYQKAINFLKGASSIETLWQIHSLNYEVLTGDKAGRSSVRVNDQYRIEFTVTLDENLPILTVCNVVELSNHYKK